MKVKNKSRLEFGIMIIRRWEDETKGGSESWLAEGTLYKYTEHHIKTISWSNFMKIVIL